MRAGRIYILILSLFLLSGCFGEITNTPNILDEAKQTRVESSDFTALRIGINPGGTYTKPVQAYLTCKGTKGWLAKWTVDGTEPTWTNGGWSYNPIIITKTIAIQITFFFILHFSNN